MQIQLDPSRLDRLLKYIFLHRLSARLLIVLLSILSTLLGLLAPLFQKDFLDQLTGMTSDLSIPMMHTASPSLLLGLSFLSLLLAQLFVQINNYISVREALIFQKDLGEKMYQRTLSLRTDTLAGKSVGELVSLFATDVQGGSILLEQSLPAGALILFPLILTPVLLISILRIPAAPTLTVVLILVVFNAIMAYRQSQFFFLFKQLAADRIGVVNEWVQNIRALRILGWTDAFEGKIKDKREAETFNRVRMVTNGQTMNAIASTITFFINVVAMASLLWLTDTALTPGKVLAIFWIVGVFLIRPFRMMPWFFTFIMDGVTSLRRMQAFFGIVDQNVQNHVQRSLDLSTIPKRPQIVVRGLNLEIQGQVILRNLDFDIKDGEFFAVVGAVASGKSSLLLSFLGENGASFEEFKVGNVDLAPLLPKERKKVFSYVAQDGFIMSARLRDNVVMTYHAVHSLDKDIKNSLRIAQFDIDEEDVPLGLETEIGERGVNLSGGQKQRVNLGRAHYFTRPVILLDDCLSAVDVETERLLIDRLLGGAWQNCTRILVTHRLSVLQKVDRIMFLEEGKIKAIGSYQNLIETCGAFKEFVLLAPNKPLEKESAP